MFCGAEDLSLTLLLNPDLSVTSFPTEEIARSIPNSFGVFVFVVVFDFLIFFFLLAVLLANAA